MLFLFPIRDLAGSEVKSMRALLPSPRASSSVHCPSVISLRLGENVLDAKLSFAAVIVSHSPGGGSPQICYIEHPALSSAFALQSLEASCGYSAIPGRKLEPWAAVFPQ